MAKKKFEQEEPFPRILAAVRVWGLGLGFRVRVFLGGLTDSPSVFRSLD